MLLIYSNQAYTELAIADLSSILVVVYMGIFPGALGYLFWGMLLDIYQQLLPLAFYISCQLFLYFLAGFF